MYYVYLIKSKADNFLYIGSAKDLKRRVFEHNNGKVQSTKYYAPFNLVYYEAYSDELDAVVREKRLKHHGSVVGHLKRRVKHSLAGKPVAKGV
jgi:putative endonuclease